jgi:hypothetical protein
MPPTFPSSTRRALRFREIPFSFEPPVPGFDVDFFTRSCALWLCCFGNIRRDSEISGRYVGPEKLRIRRRRQTPNTDITRGSVQRCSLTFSSQAAFINQSRPLARIGAPDPRASGDCDRKIRRHASGEPRSNPPSRATQCAKRMECANFKWGLLWRFGNMAGSGWPLAASHLYFLFGRRGCRRRSPGLPPFPSINSTQVAVIDLALSVSSERGQPLALNSKP